MKEFLKTVSYKEFEDLLGRLELKRNSIIVRSEVADNHIASENILSTEEIPGFYRSTVDGYAVRFEDTQGASPSVPSMLKLAGEVKMGEISDIYVKNGEAVKISTGGALPEGANSVAMQEDTEEMGEWVEIYKSVGMNENTVKKDEDYKRGEIIVRKGEIIAPNKIQALISSGIYEIPVYDKLKVAIISTGDEIIDYKSVKRERGKIRDTNSFLLSKYLEKLGEDITFLGIAKDDRESLKNIIKSNINSFDLFLISGGSSMGTRDITVNVLSEFSEIIFHGIRVYPGKPLIFGKSKEKVFVGLPGHPVSSFVSIFTIVYPLVLAWEGADNFKISPSGYVKIDKNINKKVGRESFVLVKKYEMDGEFLAKPLFGESGLVSLIAEATGFVRIEESREGAYQGESLEYYEF